VEDPQFRSMGTPVGKGAAGRWRSQGDAHQLERDVGRGRVQEQQTTLMGSPGASQMPWGPQLWGVRL